MKVSRVIQKAVVTGATGAIGSALCRRLLERNIAVYAICRPGTFRTINLPPHDKLKIIYCDMKKLDELPKSIVDGADVFFHLAWSHTIGPGRNDTLAQIENIQSSVKAVQVASAIGCKLFIGAGSQAEYGRVEGVLTARTPCFPENGYGSAKLCAGQMTRIECEKYNMEHIWTRILSVYGPCDGSMTMISSTISKLLKREIPSLTSGEQIWDYLYSDDAADAMIALAKYGVSGKTYPLGSGKAAPLKEYVTIIRDLIDPSLQLGFGVIPYSPFQVMHLQADISDLIIDTGFAPQTKFADGIQNTIRWFESTNGSL